MEAIKVLLADDHDIVLEGYKSILDDENHIEVVAKASNGEEVLEALHRQKVDVVLLDLNMPKLDGMGTATKMKSDFPKVKILILTMFEDALHIKQMVDIGVDGYLLKNSNKTTLLRAIELVHEGESYFDGDITKTILNNFKQKVTVDNADVELSERELQIITLIAEGISTKDIAEKLFLSPHTVKTHRKNINFKLDIHSPMELIHFAKKKNLIS